jgi:hypothetical protein
LDLEEAAYEEGNHENLEHLEVPVIKEGKRVRGRDGEEVRKW